MKNYTLYWYHLPSHKNPYTEGYIGITNDIHRRKNEHLRNVGNGKNTHFYNAYRKYIDSIQCDILHCGLTPEEALTLEYEYRNKVNVGWNSAVGGEDTLQSIRVTPISLYHKDNPTCLYTFESITTASNVLGITAGSLRQRVSRKSNTYGKDGWAVLHCPDQDRLATMTPEEALSKGLTGLKRSKPSHFKGVTNRWSDEDKARISKQHKGKTISQEQREIMRAKNRFSPQCKSIVLQHESDDKIYTFHSISEASRQLDIPLSRLKSKAQRPLNRYGKDGWKIISLGSE